MKEISIDGNLSTIYTNHTRATSVTVLDNCGIEARHIKSFHGRCSETSIHSYARTGVGMNRKMFELSNFCHSREQTSNSINETINYCDNNIVQWKKPLALQQSSRFLADYSSSHKKTFDFSVNIDVEFVNEDKCASSNNNQQIIQPQVPKGSSISTLVDGCNHNINFQSNNQLKNRFRSKMSSIIGDCAQYFEFSNYTFNF